MAERIRVLLVDDHAVVRQGLRSFLELQPDIEVVGEAAGARDGVELAARLSPDVVLMDLLMPDEDGVDAIRALRDVAPRVRVLVLTSYLDDTHVFAAVQAGAAGYLLKDVQPDALTDGIRQVSQGLAVLHPTIAARLMNRTGRPPSLADFTQRERDVLKLLAEGLSNKEIAGRLFISEKTVKTHVSNVLQKLGVADRTQAALLAVRQRLVE
ncbi:MAG TPA: response regulator transcription factor [Candidatus Limnocylindria bacterium]|nr:response regulator transcription factor [Candidatus Dormibacteraeota bacterium]HYS29045.1 response regulator transcription factor [Candidatus Limnocylindria bacterium]